MLKIIGRPQWLRTFLRILSEHGVGIVRCLPTPPTHARMGCWSLQLVDVEHNHYGIYEPFYVRFAEQANVTLYEFRAQLGREGGARVGIIVGPGKK